MHAHSPTVINKSSLSWKINRLRAMGLPEILYRTRQALKSMLQQHGVGLAHVPSRHGVDFGLPWANLGHRIQVYPAPYVEAADQILDGRFRLFNLENSRIGFPPDWNRDPKTGIRAPLVFGKSIDYRLQSNVGDIKYLWEPNRHLELVTLAQAWYLTQDSKYMDGCRTLLDSWMKQCPYPFGPNWISSLEHAIRLVNWSFAWHLLSGPSSPMFTDDGGAAFRERWLGSIYQHCHFIRGHMSYYSSANNHLFGEYMGLFVASLVWPVWPESGEWQAFAKHGLEREALKQNMEDGVNREQSTWYHHEVADMMLLCGLIGRANGVEFSAQFWRRLELMLEFILSMMAHGHHIPMIGDADDAVMVRLGMDNANVCQSLLATGAVIFKRDDFKVKAGTFDDKSRWLLGNGAEDQFWKILTNGKTGGPRRAFPDGGYYVLGDRLDSDEEIRLILDGGELGYLSIAAHGHADALSFTLFVGGSELLIDSGTYAYHTMKKWRDYFRGTSAHNTIRVDGLDQSVSGGNFLWLRHANARCTGFDTGGEVETWAGEHDGYTRLDDPVVHCRLITFDKTRRVIHVRDTLKCTEKHIVEIFWHFAETCVVVAKGSRVTATAGKVALRMGFQSPDWIPQIIVGCDEPPQGWISRKFDEKLPAPCIIWSGEITGTTELVTELQIEIAH
jgi:hypothetical protein